MARRTRGRAKREFSPAASRRLVGNQLQSPVLDWQSPPTIRPLPEVKDLLALNDAELLKVLQYFGFEDSWPAAEQAAAKYVERITQRRWRDKDELQAEVRKLATTATTDGRRSLAKRAYGEYTVHLALGPDDPATAIWTRIGEGDDHQCDGCYGAQGEEGTLAYHESIGWRGARCHGGDRCRCEYLRSD